ncbi:acetate--CoA ligase family protein [Acidovorax sp. Be4]|uniref:Acetate--CoA ligase family protein n=1 Tax=Acidovorax bellezanensis TaxID=2976702 RepID=A0ABT2PLE0_9BURK|nr:acetate--CoA ligase family protein [Acidovorax sp. Be4]MCT9810664.1 acetate--CoA ligase family protein [Acidovorax sp. Be4]
MHHDIDSLSALFSPRSIAIVGASATPSKIGGIPLDYLLRFGFQGPLYAVNPRGGLVQGLAAHASLDAIGAPVDLAIFAIPAALVPAALDDAIAAGVKSIVLFSSGFAEIGDQGAAEQARLAHKARAAGIRLIGPNCLGFMHLARNVYATFSPAPGVGRVQPGRIGLVSQSGAFGAYAYSMARERGIGLSLWATTGNEADVQVADCLAWLAQDPGTDVIMAYMEGCRDGPKLRAALALAQANHKPVVMVKVGTTALGAEAAASHTASLAGDDAVYDAIFRQYGVLRAHTLSEFFDLAASAAIAGTPRDRSIGLFTLSGGVGAMMADDASAAGLDVRPLSSEAQQTLRDWVPFAAPRNPVDITGQVTNDFTLMERSARVMLEDQNFASWMGFFAAAGASDKVWPVLHQLVTSLRAAYPDTVLAICTLLSPARRAEIEALGCLVFSDPSVGIRTIAALAGRGARPVSAPVRTLALPEPVRLPPGTLSEPMGLALLSGAGVPVVEHHLVQSADEAVLALTALGGEIALKIASADIPHKSDIGGVALGLRSAEQVQAAFARMQTSVRAAQPTARLDGVLAARMVRGGVECIAGVHRDPVFGPVLMFGLGGVHVEILRDVSLRALPVTRAEVQAMVLELKGLPLLQGARGRPAVDLESIADSLLALADFATAAGDTLQSAEINPLIARPAAEGGCVAVDALVIGHAAPAAASPVPPLSQPLQEAIA